MILLILAVSFTLGSPFSTTKSAQVPLCTKDYSTQERPGIIFHRTSGWEKSSVDYTKVAMVFECK
jgi:hypothetical protein